MQRFTKRAVFALMLLLIPLPAATEEIMVEDFRLAPETRWRFFTDGVMGGVSAGQVSFVEENGQAHARMTGSVSTKNNGGFIQMRTALPDGMPKDKTGVRLVVRGNNQRYFVHLRTSGTVLPWQYYQAGFEVTGDWATVRLPLDAFRPSGGLLRTTPRPQDVRSIAIVAFGRDHEAEIDVREVTLD